MNRTARTSNTHAPSRQPSTEPPKPGRVRRLLRQIKPPIGDLRKHKAAFLWILGSVLLLRPCWPPMNLWAFGFIGLVPWLWALRGTTPRTAFWLSWVFGALHCYTLYFFLNSVARFPILHLGPLALVHLGVPLLALYQGLFIGAAGAGMVAIARRFDPWLALPLAALLWAGQEWFRCLGPLALPYGLLGASVRHWLSLTQIISLGGVVLLSSLVLAVNLVLMEAIAATVRRQWDLGVAGRLATVLLLVVAGALWGAGRLSADRETASLRVAILQPNVSQDEKFASYASGDYERAKELLSEHNRLMLDLLDQQILAGGEPLDLVVLPESAFAGGYFDYDEDLQRELRNRADELGAPILAGAVDNIFVAEDGTLTQDLARAARLEDGYPDSRIYGAVFLFPPDSDPVLKVASDYRKVHLMPFGETIPFISFFPKLEQMLPIGGFLSGEPDQPGAFIHRRPREPLAQGQPVKLGPTICFEDLMPYLHRRMARSGVQLFLNLTNDAWFDPSLGSQWHYEHVALRCIETGIPQVRCANSGVTAVIDGVGRELARLPLREKDSLILEVPVPVAAVPPTLYVRLGEWWGILGLFVPLAVFATLRWRRGKEPQKA